MYKGRSPYMAKDIDLMEKVQRWATSSYYQVYVIYDTKLDLGDLDYIHYTVDGKEAKHASC